MIYLTQAQEDLYNIIKNKPGIMWSEMAAAYNRKSTSEMIKILVQKGAIRRKGTRSKYRYYTVDIEYKIQDRRNRGNDCADPIAIMHRNAVFTAAQRRYVKSNKDKPRTQLAKELGMSKLEFNSAMEKIGGAT
ncbi:hypothetical protein [Paenibacillus sp. IITD108]|uniref:hypothetical protein n=1 Tax=Paenibacillus sp. IITD108 TaxID=3116649 RepID=UPI002F417866